MKWKKFIGLHGPDGCGKSHMAATIAEVCNNRNMFRNGVLWIDMSEVTDDQQLRDAITTALDGSNGHTDITRYLHNIIHLRETHEMLLVLDNAGRYLKQIDENAPTCESASKFIRQLLTTHVRIVLTSRYKAELNLGAGAEEFTVLPVVNMDEMIAHCMGENALMELDVDKWNELVLKFFDGNPRKMEKFLQFVEQEREQNPQMTLDDIFESGDKLMDMLSNTSEHGIVAMGSEQANEDWQATFLPEDVLLKALFVKGLLGSAVFDVTGLTEDDCEAMCDLWTNEDSMIQLDRVRQVFKFVAPYDQTIFLTIAELITKPWFHGYQTINANIESFVSRHGDVEEGTFLVRISSSKNTLLLHIQQTEHNATLAGPYEISVQYGQWSVMIGEMTWSGASLMDFIEQGEKQGVLVTALGRDGLIGK